MKRIISGIIVTLLLVGMLTLAFNIQRAKAQIQTIYINPDGSVTPSTANIITADKVTYTFTGDNRLPIVVNRSNIIINGNGRELYTNAGIGFSIIGVSNVTIENTDIGGNSRGIFLYSSSGNILFRNKIVANWHEGIYLNSSSGNVLSNNTITRNGGDGVDLWDSSNNNILSNNNVTGNGLGSYGGIGLFYSSGNILFGNNATRNIGAGITLDHSSGNILSDNNFSDSERPPPYVSPSSYGIVLSIRCSGNVFSGNDIANCDFGIFLGGSSGNTFYHNNFVGNVEQISSDGSPNTWDDGYPSGGNYWGDYLTKYPNATEIDHTGIGNTPYVIDVNNTDHYPLISLNTWKPLLGDVNHDGVVNILDVVIAAKAYGCVKGDPKWNPYADLNNDGKIDMPDLVTIVAHYGQKYS